MIALALGFLAIGTVAALLARDSLKRAQGLDPIESSPPPDALTETLSQWNRRRHWWC